MPLPCAPQVNSFGLCKMDFSDFDLVVLKASKRNKKKISRKRSQLDIKLGESYPPEGHCSIKDSGNEERLRIFCFGGARRGEDGSWLESSNILEFILKVDDKNALISSIVSCKTKGGILPPLQSAAVVQHNRSFIIWGGLDLVHYECRDDIIILDEIEGTARGRGAAAPFTTFDVTYVQTAKNVVPSKRGVVLNQQTGTVPKARTGHTLTKLGNTSYALMFGGVSFERQERGFVLQWEKSCRDGRFYVLNMTTLSWSLIKVPPTQARAYHSADCIERDGTLVFVIVGGLTFDEQASMEATREPIHEALVLRMPPNLDNPVLQTVTLEPTSALTSIYVSYHATSVLGNSIIVHGGYQQETGKVTQNIPSTKAYQLDLDNKRYCLLDKTATYTEHSVFATAGHSLVNNTTDFVCIGGTSRQISVLSDRDFEEDDCDLPTCHIQDSNDKEIGWVQCDIPRCGKWFHQFCLGLKRIPEKYYCRDCKK